MYKKFDLVLVVIDQQQLTAFVSKTKNASLEICAFDDDLGTIRTETVLASQITGYANGDIPFALTKVLEHNKSTQTFKKGTKVKFYDRKAKMFVLGIINANLGDYARVMLSEKEAGETRRVAKVLLTEV